MKNLIFYVTLLASLSSFTAAKSCWHNNDCTSRWVGYSCDCANARRKFIIGMEQQGINCWPGAGFGVGCENMCGGSCDCGDNHYWEGSC
jgi:hypothetical protein